MFKHLHMNLLGFYLSATIYITIKNPAFVEMSQQELSFGKKNRFEPLFPRGNLNNFLCFSIKT